VESWTAGRSREEDSGLFLSSVLAPASGRDEKGAGISAGPLVESAPRHNRLPVSAHIYVIIFDFHGFHPQRDLAGYPHNEQGLDKYAEQRQHDMDRRQLCQQIVMIKGLGALDIRNKAHAQNSTDEMAHDPPPFVVLHGAEAIHISVFAVFPDMCPVTVEFGYAVNYHHEGQNRDHNR
jgi:hypothetical protein